MKLTCSRYVLSRTARSGEPEASSQASVFLLASHPSPAGTAATKMAESSRHSYLFFFKFEKVRASTVLYSSFVDGNHVG